MNDVGANEALVARSWDHNAAVWADHVRSGWDVYREYFNQPAFAAFLGDVRGKQVLDAGCGEGTATRMLARAGAHVTGIDLSPEMIRLAQEAEQHEPLGIGYAVASFTNLHAYPDASFDLVVSWMALMDSPNLAGAIHELTRVLRAGGTLAFNILHPCFMTKGFGWSEDATSGEQRLTVGGYFDEQPNIERWRFSKGDAPKDAPPFVVPRFHHPLSTYLNLLIEAGCAIERIEEPRPTEAMCEQHAWLRRWRDHAAIYLYVRARKQ
jgi:SAM-dependent methyltransferase